MIVAHLVPAHMLWVRRISYGSLHLHGSQYFGVDPYRFSAKFLMIGFSYILLKKRFLPISILCQMRRPIRRQRHVRRHIRHRYRRQRRAIIVYGETRIVDHGIGKLRLTRVRIEYGILGCGKQVDLPATVSQSHRLSGGAYVEREYHGT